MITVAGAIAQVVDRKSLSAIEMSQVIGHIMDGAATEAQVGALLIGLRMKGESIAEIVGAARAMRQRAEPFDAPSGLLVDTCGTGGDGHGSFNVSTVAALVVAAGGVRVAKSGNRSVSSRCGSADVLEALGMRLDQPIATVERCLAELNVGFLFAPAFHPAMRRVALLRRQLGLRTLFNLLGPLTNPAGAQRQLVGVFAAEKVEPLAHALGELGCEHALVVHGAGGLDELSPIGETQVAEMRRSDGNFTVNTYRWSPADFGLASAPLEQLVGGDAKQNASAVWSLLRGEKRDAARTAVLMSAAATFYLAGETDLAAAARRAEQLLDDGAVLQLLEHLVLFWANDDHGEATES